MDLAEEFPDCRLVANSSGWSVVCHRPDGSIEMTAVWGGEHRAEICQEFARRQPIPWPWGMGSTHDVVEICKAARRVADEYLTPVPRATSGNRNNFSEFHLTQVPIRLQYTHDTRLTRVEPSPGR